MKQRSTTPVSKGLVTKSILVAAAVLMVMAAPMSMVTQVHADKFDDQINALQQQVNAYKSQAGVLQSKIGTLQDAVTALQLQQNAIQAQIDLNQTKLEQLQQQIKDTEQKIKDNKDALGTTLADMYVDNTISPLEMLASAKNIGDYVDKQSYQASVTDQLQQTITKINDLKTQLDKDKTSVESVLTQQTAQRNSLDASKAQQQTLLDETKGQEAAYQALISSAQQSMANAAAQQNAYYQSLLRSSGGGSSGVVGSFQYSNWSGDRGCSGGYSYCQAPDSVTDEWALYNRECVSYVAWALQYRFGKSVNSFQGQGNAYQWPDSAPQLSGAVRVYNPQRGDAVILPASSNFAPIGHAMIVESVNGDTMHVSQFNMYGTHGYSEMDIKNSGVILLRFPNA
ncbi:MAG: coiled-coil domain-containing protein [Candidatus Saccharimonadales bacterium]